MECHAPRSAKNKKNIPYMLLPSANFVYIMVKVVEGLAYYLFPHDSLRHFHILRNLLFVSASPPPPPPPQFDDEDELPMQHQEEDPYAATEQLMLAKTDWIPSTYLEKGNILA